MPKTQGWLLKKAQQVITKYGNAGSFALEFRPDQQAKYALSISDTIFGDYPTMRHLLSAYTLDQMHIWVIAQVIALNEYTTVKEKMSLPQMQTLASGIITWALEKSLKASEILLFFHLFQRGEFEGFYGVVDPMQIALSMPKFIKWRADRVDKIQQLKAVEDKEAKIKKWRETAITREEYNKLKEKKDELDKEKT